MLVCYEIEAQRLECVSSSSLAVALSRVALPMMCSISLVSSFVSRLVVVVVVSWCSCDLVILTQCTCQSYLKYLPLGLFPALGSLIVERVSWRCWFRICWQAIVSLQLVLHRVCLLVDGWKIISFHCIKCKQPDLRLVGTSLAYCLLYSSCQFPSFRCHEGNSACDTICLVYLGTWLLAVPLFSEAVVLCV